MTEVNQKSSLPDTQKAYRLTWDIDHLPTDVEDPQDAWLVKFPDAPSAIMDFLPPVDLEMPERIEFRALHSLLEETDYPHTDVRWPIMSRRMLNTLLSVGSFAHRAYPLVMYNIESVYKEELGDYAMSGEENHDYVVIQLLERLEVFDWENSIYQRDPEYSYIIDSVEKMVLKEPEDGFPSLFCIDAAISDFLYVSATARQALEAAGIKGIDLRSVKNYY